MTGGNQPTVTAFAVYPVAGRDSMEVNYSAVNVWCVEMCCTRPLFRRARPERRGFVERLLAGAACLGVASVSRRRGFVSRGVACVRRGTVFVAPHGR